MIPETTNGIITGYTIRCNTTGSDIMMLAPLTVDESTLTTTLEGLTPFTEYTCTISASTDAGEGNSSDPQTATTDEDGKRAFANKSNMLIDTCSIVLSAPTNFMLTRVDGSSTTLSASWNVPETTNGIISNYTIRCNTTGSDIMMLAPLTVDKSTLTTTLEGLIPFTEYTCTISASTGAGEGDSSGPQTATTDEDGKGIGQ